MNKLQLSLMTSLSLDNSEAAPLPPSRNPMHGIEKRVRQAHLIALQMLMQGPVLLDLLRLRAGVGDYAAFLAELRGFGFQLPVCEVPAVGAGDAVVRENVCQMTQADVRRVYRLIKKLERNDA